jgi:hypothetical protein
MTTASRLASYHATTPAFSAAMLSTLPDTSQDTLEQARKGITRR